MPYNFTDNPYKELFVIQVGLWYNKQDFKGMTPMGGKLLLVSMKVGEAADAGAFNWFHPNLASLKECLSKMEGE